MIKIKKFIISFFIGYYISGFFIGLIYAIFKYRIRKWLGISGPCSFIWLIYAFKYRTKERTDDSFIFRINTIIGSIVILPFILLLQILIFKRVSGSVIAFLCGVTLNLIQFITVKEVRQMAEDNYIRRRTE